MKRVKHYQTILEFCGFFPFDFRGLCENWLIKHAHNGFQIETRLHFKSSFQHFIYSGYVCCWVVDALQVAYWWFQYYFISSCTYFIACTGWYVLIFVKFSTHYPTNIELFLVSHQEISLRTIEQSKFFWSKKLCIHCSSPESFQQLVSGKIFFHAWWEQISVQCW